jgi:hypothetical protein
MQKNQKGILNDLKKSLLNEFEYIRYVRREGNTVKFFAGTWKAQADECNPGFTKQQIARGWFPLGMELDLAPYKQYIDNLAIPGLTTEIVWSCPYITPQPELVATLKV